MTSSPGVSSAIKPEPQRPGVMAQVGVDHTGHKEIAVVVALVHGERERAVPDAGGAACFCQPAASSPRSAGGRKAAADADACRLSRCGLCMALCLPVGLGWPGFALA